MVISTLRIYTLHANCFKQNVMNNMLMGLEIPKPLDFCIVGYFQHLAYQPTLLVIMVIFCLICN